MTSQQILQSDFIDILFDGRNKAYGAYQLRRGYSSSLLKAIGITLLIVAALILFVPSSAEKVSSTSTVKDITITDVVVPESKPKEPEPVVQQRPAAATPPVRTEVFIEDYTTVDESKNPMASQEALENANPGGEGYAGPPAGGPPTPPGIPAGTGVAKPEEPFVEPAPALPSRQPQFPGGQAAWMRFLERFLQSPEEMEEGERRTVSVKFIVDEEGTITAFQVVQSGGAAFDNEVIRVLKKMPKWLPAIQNGKPAKVTFTQPVTFATGQTPTP